MYHWYNTICIHEKCLKNVWKRIKIFVKINKFFIYSGYCLFSCYLNVELSLYPMQYRLIIHNNRAQRYFLPMVTHWLGVSSHSASIVNAFLPGYECSSTPYRCAYIQVIQYSLQLGMHYMSRNTTVSLRWCIQGNQ